jgi:hypothetical protein
VIDFSRIEGIMKEAGMTPEHVLRIPPRSGLSAEERQYLENLVKGAAPSRFRSIADAAISRGELRVLPIEIGGKNPAIKWARSADNIRDGVDTRIDTFTSKEWAAVVGEWVNDLAERFPELNACVVAKPDEQVFVDCDTYAEFISAYERFTGEQFPVTYTTSARENRTQIHFQQTDATRKMGNVSQFAVDGIDLSVRQRNQYVLAEGSQHPSGSVYQRVVDAPIAQMPDKLVAFIEHLEKTAKTAVEAPAKASMESKGVDATVEGPKIKHGHHDNTLRDVARKLRGMGWQQDTILERLVAVCRSRCENYGSDYQEMCEKHAKSAMKFQPNEDKSLALNQSVALQQPSEAQAVAPPPSQEKLNLDTSEGATRPVFPIWAIQGTSIYENLVKPAVATSSKFEEFIFVPAMQVMMNFLSRKVNIELQPTNLNMFVGLVSPYGEFFKSTSCGLAHKYFQYAAISSEASGSKSSESSVETSHVLISVSGSPEGFGLSMKKKNCRQSILFNDELGKFVSKAGIDSSSFSSDLLSWYGSGYFGNTVTNGKNNFAFETGTYTFGWLWATTDRGFNRHWPKLAGMSSGIEDRMFFVVSPEKPKPAGPYSDPDISMMEGALKTRALIDKAINQRLYRIEEPEMYAKRAKGLDPRSFDLLKKLSLYLAVDLNLDVIDDDCMERARALVDYRNQAAAFLEPIEADNAEGRLMKEIVRELHQNKGKMPYRDLCRDLDYRRHGMKLWKSAYYGLLNHGDIAEFQEVRTPGKRATRMVGLVKHEEDE